MKTTDNAPAPNHRPRFRAVALPGSDILCASPASPAAVGEAQRCFLAHADASRPIPTPG